MSIDTTARGFARRLKPAFLRRLGPKRFGWLKQQFDRHLFRYRGRSYSQVGEDRVLARYFRNQPTGVYVDVGAFHPHQLSNTQLLHEKGWRGLNIDATPGSMRLFDALRPGDVNLELAISDQPGALKLHSWGMHAENTVAPDQVRAATDQLGPPMEIVEVETKTLTEVLDASVFRDQPIDLLNVDAEGSDFAVLRSLDWARYKPGVIVTEIFTSSLEGLLETERYAYLAERGYRVMAWSPPSVIFTCNEPRRR